jgi:competence protein ComEC
MPSAFRTRFVRAIASLAVASWLATCSAADLEVAVFDVGQADAILVTCPDRKHHLLIDSGDTRYPGSSTAFREEMRQRFPGEKPRLDVVVASHPHQDHIGSMQWVLENFKVGTYVDNGDKHETATFGRLNKLRQKLQKQHKLVYVNGKKNSFESIDFCDKVKLELVEPWALSDDLTDKNDRSVGVRLEHDKVTFLFMGDMHDEAEHVLLDELSEGEQRRLLDVEVLKVGHHGSDTSSSPRFLEVVTPQHALISCGEKDVGTNDGYKHPRSVTLAALNATLKDNKMNGRVWAFDKSGGRERWRQMARREGIWVTPRDGMITVRSNGQSVTVEVENP